LNRLVCLNTPVLLLILMCEIASQFIDARIVCVPLPLRQLVRLLLLVLDLVILDAFDHVILFELLVFGSDLRSNKDLLDPVCFTARSLLLFALIFEREF
jgi:hypothetical protein